MTDESDRELLRAVVGLSACFDQGRKKAVEIALWLQRLNPRAMPLVEDIWQELASACGDSDLEEAFVKNIVNVPPPVRRLIWAAVCVGMYQITLDLAAEAFEAADRRSDLEE